MDNLDTSIIWSLNENARKSYRDIARELNVSLSTVSNRIHGMEQEGIIKGYVPVLDPQKIGYDLTVIIGVKISKGKLLEVQKKIARDDRVFGVYDVTGDWDSILMARLKNRMEVNDFIKNIVAMEFIERTYTQVVLNTVKEEKKVLL